MPSIRVRRPSYAPLSGRDADDLDATPHPPLPPRSLANIFSPALNQTPIQPSTRLRPRNFSTVEDVPPISRPHARRRTTTAASFTPPRPPITRPRAGSRVADHVISNRARILGTAHPSLTLRSHAESPVGYGFPMVESSAGRSPVARDMVEFEGSNTDVLMRNSPGDREPGRIGSALSLHTSHDGSFYDERAEEHDDIVEHLDVIDPQISTVSSLTNAANAILIPPLTFYSRKPVVVLASPPRRNYADLEKRKDSQVGLDDSLDRHVEDVLARKDKFRRTMIGIWSFLKTPTGAFTGFYGFLVAFWGAAIVIFLAKIIDFHNSYRQSLWVEISSQIETGLFSLNGIALIPYRIQDTYRMYKIWHYKRKTRQLREKAGLHQLYDVDDLPDPMFDPNYVHVLEEGEERDLHHQQELFRESQTWYRPHGTETHRAFPINTALLICLLIDGNSIFQIMLSGTMWGLNMYNRPAWTEGILIPASFLCGIFAGVFIWRGGQKTKRTEKVEERLRAALAMERPNQDYLPESVTEDGSASSSANPAINVEEPEAEASGSKDGDWMNGAGGWDAYGGPPILEKLDGSGSISRRVDTSRSADVEVAIDEHMTVPSVANH